MYAHTHTHTHTCACTPFPPTHTHTHKTHTESYFRAMGLKKRFCYNAHTTPHMNISPGIAVVRVCLATGSTHRLVLQGTLAR